MWAPTIPVVLRQSGGVTNPLGPAFGRGRLARPERGQPSASAAKKMRAKPVRWELRRILRRPSPPLQRFGLFPRGFCSMVRVLRGALKFSPRETVANPCFSGVSDAFAPRSDGASSVSASLRKSPVFAGCGQRSGQSRIGEFGCVPAPSVPVAARACRLASGPDGLIGGRAATAADRSNRLAWA